MPAPVAEDGHLERSSNCVVRMANVAGRGATEAPARQRPLARTGGRDTYPIVQPSSDPIVAPSFELFDHTADLGLRVRAATHDGLLVPATRALYAAIGELAPGQPGPIETFDLSNDAPASGDTESGDDAAAGLLRDYLTELLVLFDRNQRMVTNVQVEQFDEKGLRVRADTAFVDEQRSAYYREVKAITYHELAVRPVPGGCEATLIVDI